MVFSPDRSHAIAFNLFHFDESLVLVNAYIVSVDMDGTLLHMQKKAIPETLPGYGFPLDEQMLKLMDLLDKLQPKYLEENFKISPKRTKPLEELLKDPAQKARIVKFVHKRMDEVLSILVKHQIFLCWDMERKALVKDYLMVLHRRPLKAFLWFHKSTDGVVYRLSLGDDRGKKFQLSRKPVRVITNHPAWIVLGEHLNYIEHINGNMVLPFLEKDEVFIPRQTVRDYFQKFILKAAMRLDIEADGFDILKINQLSRCRLETTKDIFTGHWGIVPHMVYQSTSFIWSDTQRKRTSLDFKDNEEVAILQIQRDSLAEKEKLDLLVDLGIRHEENSFWLPAGAQKQDPLEAIEWMVENKVMLLQAGLEIGEIETDIGVVKMSAPQISLTSTAYNDWFDIHAIVTVGVFQIPFTKIAPYIIEENRFYPLPDGSYFVIPAEWMTKYRGLAQFGKRENDVLKIKKSQFTLLEEIILEDSNQPLTANNEPEISPSPLLLASLRPYQKEGFNWLIRHYYNELGACLADDMGLGKTLQTIAVLLFAKDQKSTALSLSADDRPKSDQLSLFDPPPDTKFLNPLNALIVLPASLVFNWEAELKKFAPSLSVNKMVGQGRIKDPRVLSRFDVILTTYHTALRDVETLCKMHFEYIVLDESQQIKNKDSQVFKAINQLPGKHKVSLSGTPIENSLSDLWSQMQVINPGLLGSFSFFKKEFITPIEKGKNEDKKAQLKKLVAPYLLRRTKEQVAKDLPPLTVKVFYSEMSPEQSKVYEKEKSAARNYLLENFQPENPQYQLMAVQTLTKLRQMANHPGLVVEDYKKDSGGKFDDILAHHAQVQKSGHKVLMFSSFVKYLELFKQGFEKNNQPFAWLTGSVPLAQRKNEIQKFEERSDITTFLISIKAGGTGLNLTSADYVFILDPWWNPTTELQAISRAHRIGQDKNVVAIKFITKDSIEEKILKLQEQKSQLAEDIIEGTSFPKLSKQELTFLLN